MLGEYDSEVSALPPAQDKLSQPATPLGTERLRQWRYRPSLSVRDQSSQVYVDPDYAWPSTKQQTAEVT